MNRQFAQKYNCLSPEDINCLEYYTFTLSPQEQPLQTNLGKMKLNCIYNWYHEKIIRSLNRLHYCKYTLFTEISKSGRLHYHGTIKIEEIAMFYYHDVPLLKHIGTYEIDTIKDHKIWKTYCLKQKGFMRDFCTKNDIEYVINTNGTLRSDITMVNSQS